MDYSEYVKNTKNREAKKSFECLNAIEGYRSAFDHNNEYLEAEANNNFDRSYKDFESDLVIETNKLSSKSPFEKSIISLMKNLKDGYALIYKYATNNEIKAWDKLDYLDDTFDNVDEKEYYDFFLNIKDAWMVAKSLPQDDINSLTAFAVPVEVLAGNCTKLPGFKDLAGKDQNVWTARIPLNLLNGYNVVYKAVVSEEKVQEQTGLTCQDFEKDMYGKQDYAYQEEKDDYENYINNNLY